MTDFKGELEALNQYHQTLASKDQHGQASLLRNGFLPEAPEALIEAGIRCMPLIESGVTELSEAAVDRLAAIQFKLKMQPETPAVRKAMDEFDARLQAQKREDSKASWYGCTAILALAAIIGGTIVLIIYYFTH